MVKSMAVKSGYDPYRDPIENEASLREIADIATASAPDFDKVLRHIVENGLTPSPAAVFDETMADHAPLKAVASACVDAFVGAFPTVDREKLFSTVSTCLKEAVIEQMALLPTSDWLRVIPPLASVEMCWIPGLSESGSVEGLAVSHWSVRGPTLDTLVPDENFARLLRLANLSSDHYLEAVSELRQFDPRTGPTTPASASDSYEVRCRRENAARWADFHVERDLTLPQLLNGREVVEIVESGGHGGVPVIVCRVPLRDFLARDPSKPAILSGGGFLGLHDFINGSGRIEQPMDAIRVPNLLGWKVPSVARDAINGVHKIVESYYEVSLSDAPARKPWKEVRKGVWSLPAKDGGAVEISFALASDGAEEFWVRTLDANGYEHGPWATAEVLGVSFDEACKPAELVAEQDWDSLSPAP